MEKNLWEKEIQKDDRKIAQIEKAIRRAEKIKDEADTKKELRDLRHFEKLADKELATYNHETRRDYW